MITSYEKEKLKKLALRWDDDIANYDFLAYSFAEVKRQIKKRNQLRPDKFETRPFAVAYENDWWEGVDETAYPDGGYRELREREQKEMHRLTELDFEEKYVKESAV